MTLLVIRHASPSAPRPQLPAQLSGHRVLCSDCASLSEVRQCLCQLQARSADWVLLDVGAADEAQWQAEGGALQAALERLPAQYIELQAPSEPGLEARLRLQHGPPQWWWTSAASRPAIHCRWPSSAVAWRRRAEPCRSSSSVARKRPAP